MGDISFAFDERLDVHFLNSIYEGDLEHAEMVFAEFLRNIPLQLKEIEACYANAAIEEFRKKIHKSKPIFSFVGLTVCSKKAEMIEKKCQQATHISELQSLYEEWKNEIDAFIPLIENESQKIKSCSNTHEA